MADPRTLVIIGGGLAGAKAAETLREEGFDGRIVLVCGEPRLPYERPPLSKGYLTGSTPLDDAHVHPGSFYEEQRVELLLGRQAIALDVSARRVELDDGTELAYDRVLLATGATARTLPIPGADLRAVHVLRTVADADSLRERIAGGSRLAVIGAGWIGCEAAASTRRLGANVTLIEHASVPLERILGPELGNFFAQLHRAEGVELITDARVQAIEGDGTAGGVRLHDGTLVSADTIVLGVGVTPATALAETAGLAVDNGIVTDDLLRTSAPDVFAAGDVASALHPRYGRHVRVEHLGNALEQGPAAALSMLGTRDPYAQLPYFFSDQYDVGLEYWGLHEPEHSVVTRGSFESRQLQAFWLDAEGRVSAGMHVNDWDAGETIKQQVEARTVLDRERFQGAE